MSASRDYQECAGRLGPVPVRGPDLRFRTVHGYRRAFRVAGSGPPLVLVHGIGDSSETWESVMPALAQRHLVIAPDLLGHGQSDKPRADYSVAAYANGVRDLLGVLGVPRATLVGHSLGGGVAMQFAYQFPERTERLVLVGSGGGGPEVSVMLRLLSLPGAQALLHLLRMPTARWQVSMVAAVMRGLGTALGQDAPDLLRVVDALPDATARAAFTRSLRSVVDWRGQVITMLDRCYLTQGMPTLLVWGSRDAVVPVEHGHRAHGAMPGSRLEIFDGAGHFPFHSDPGRFVATVEKFLAETRPATWNLEQWRQLLRVGHTVAPLTTEEHVASERTAT
ncbi:MAG TPA: alpha/beta hydrolase [Pseudonocardia sp.]|jgi:pimeloyl-ACP methyl ester carboxylesterase